MDGFAVRALRTNDALPSKPVTLQIGPDAEYVDTGDPLPEWANAVIPIENVESLDENGNITTEIRSPKSIRIRASVAPWSHVRPLGEDIVATQLVLPAGHILRPVDLGAFAASGHQKIPVACKPKVAILPTGSELVPIGSKLKSGDILEYNSLVIAAQVKAAIEQLLRIFQINFFTLALAVWFVRTGLVGSNSFVYGNAAPF